MSDNEHFEDAVSGEESAEAGSNDGARDLKKPRKREFLPEHPLRVSDRGNKGMASTTFLSDWLSTHYEPKDDTQGEIASRVYDLYFKECVKRQDAALDYHEFLNASLKVFPTVTKETLVPTGRKTKKQMFLGLSMRPESPYFTLTQRKPKKADKDNEKKGGFNVKEFEERVVEAVKVLDKPGGVGVGKMKKYFTETFPDYHVDVKSYVLINALERLAGYGKVEHLKGVGAMAFYSRVKTEEELLEEEKEKEEKKEASKSPEEEEEKEEDKDKEDEEKDFEVEKILNRKKSRGQWLYLVRWLGYEEKDDTWEPLENLQGSEEILKECTADILKAEKKDKAERKKATKQRARVAAARAWEPSKRGVNDHLKFVLTACTDPYTASVGAIKKYIAEYYSEFDVANKMPKLKQALEKLSENGKISYVTGKGLTGNISLTDEGFAAISRSSTNNIDIMIFESIIAMSEPKGAAMSKIRKYYAQHLPGLKTAERPKNFKKSIEGAVKKGILYQVSGLGMTGSYQLMEPYTPPPATVRRILSDSVWNDGEYSDIEVRQSEPEESDDDEAPVYKPRSSTKSGRKTILSPKKQAPVEVPRPKQTGAKRAGAKRKAGPAKSKYVDDSSDEEQESSSSDGEVEQPPKKRGKQAAATAKRGKAATARGRAAPAKTKAAASPRGGKQGGTRAPAKRAPVKGKRSTARAATRDSSDEENDTDEESIASDFEDHPPPIQSGRGRGAARGKPAGRGRATPKKSPAKAVNKAAKKAVPVSIGSGPAGRNVRAKKPQFYGTPSPEYEEDSDASIEPKKKAPAKRTPAKKGRGGSSTPSKRGRGNAKPAARSAQADSDSEPASDSESDPAPLPAKGRGRGAAKAPSKSAKKAPARGRGRVASVNKRKRRNSSDDESY